MELLTGIILVIITLAACFVIIMQTIYTMQEGFFFYPTKLSPNYPFTQFSRHDELFFDTPNDGQINALLFNVKEKSKGIIIYSHGNSRSLDDWAWVHSDFTNLGYDILIYDFRTFGKSTGKLSESNLYGDLRFLLKKINETYPMDDIILYGRSIGAAVATQLATEFRVNRLILETPFSSMLSMVQASVPYIPLKNILRYKFNNKRKMKSLLCPVHILHGTEDELIPLKHGEKLYRTNGQPSSSLTIIKGANHNNLSQFDQYHYALKQILA